MHKFNIRQVEAKDLAQIAQIEKECFTNPWSLATIEAEIEVNESAYYVVAERKKQIVGYIGLWLIAGEGHIINLAVLPEFQKRQIASTLLYGLLEVTEKAGILRHTLEVRRCNFAAYRLYRKFGFEVAGVRQGYYQDNGEDALIMWRQSKA